MTEELTSFLPIEPEAFGTSMAHPEVSPEHLLGKVLQFDRIDPGTVELLALDQKR